MKVPVVTEILKANDQVARENREIFQRAGVRVVNVMASPGAGKTSLILATLAHLPAGFRAAVIEGDVAGSIDADRIAAAGWPVVQINTGGNCHLDASMVRSAVAHLDLAAVDLLFIENVGNLICPANYRLGEDLGVVVGSVPEGDDKPYKYPGMFAGADVVVLNKDDLAEVFEFDHDGYEAGIRMLNPTAPVHRVSCRSGAGVDGWVAWLEAWLAPAAALKVGAE
jgi:hydrogenase nickel incorporation protein HypB